MNKNVLVGTVVTMIVLTVLVVAAAIMMLRDPEPHAANTEPQSQPTEALVVSRPDCPSSSIAGIEMRCLGGGHAPGDLDEGVVLVNIWAWWCQPCRAELPLLDAYAREHEDVTVVGVHVDKLGANGGAVLDELGLELPSFQDPGNMFAGTLGLPAVIPTSVVIIDGQVVASFPKVFESAEDIDQAINQAKAMSS